MFMDPTKFGNQFYEQMETLFVDRFNELLHSHSFLSKVGKGVEAGLEGKKGFDDAMRQYLEKVNMPTREDIGKILQYLTRLESKIIGLEEKIEDLQDEIEALRESEKAPKKSAAPSRTAKKAGRREK
jgi:polyhydroxyalkanoic acid synthase PhaR subunit